MTKFTVNDRPVQYRMDPDTPLLWALRDASNLTGTMVYQSDGTVGTFPMDDLGGPSQVLAIADDPDHALHRRKLVPQLAAKRIHTLEAFVTAATERLWDDQVRDGHIEWM